MTTFSGKLVATADVRVAIVAARFNDFITSRLQAGAVETLVRHGVSAEQIDTAWVPGAFEIPLVAARLAATGKYAAVICLGAVIRGTTSHYEHVCAEVAKGVAAVGLQHQLPVIFGVITTDTIEQAIERAGTKAGNKGADAALAALEMIDVLAQIDEFPGQV